MREGVITVEQFAGLAEISRQAAWKSFKRGHWRGCELETSTISGARGGNSGQQYVVKVASLPVDLQERLKALQTAVEGRSNIVTGSAATRERNWWLHLLGPALEHPKGSVERMAVLGDIAAKPALDWHGRRVPVSVRTMQRKLARMEGEGSIGVLARCGRSDKGAKRVILSRLWDAAVPFDDAVKTKIAENVRQEIRGYVKAGAAFSKVRILVARYLAGETSAYGFRPNDPAMLDRICVIPKGMIRAEAQFKKVYRHKFDRKASEDDRPRVKRTTSGLQPMEIVVMDVHPIDVLVTRSDGSTATPKLLGFMDVATRRVWCDLVFLDQRGGVRNTDLIEAFAGMAMHPAFGLPEMLYADNGTEYLFADFLDEAMQLAVPVISDDHGRTSRVIRALPYNASAKPIEAWFGHFEQQFLRHCQGWIGGDRMNQKRTQIGKPVAPFGTFEAFRPYFFGLLRAYEHFPQEHGDLAGKSPDQAFNAAVELGWSATVMDPENLHSVFTRPMIRDVKQHSISVDGRKWNGPALDTYLGDKVTVRVPIYHGFNELLVLAPDGRELGIVKPEEVFSYHDPRGAQRSASRVKARNAAIRQLDRSAPDIDVGAKLIAYGADQISPAAPEPKGRVSVIGYGAKTITPEYRPEQANTDKQRELDEIRESRALAAENAWKMRDAS